MPELQDFVRGVLLPGFLAGIGLALVWRPWNRAPAEERAPKRAWAALFFAIAFFASYAALFEPPPRPFTGTRTLGGVDWTIWIALVAGPVLFAGSFLGRFAVALWALLAGAVLFAVPRAMVRYHWSGGEAAVWLAGLAILLLLVGCATTGLGRRTERASLPIVLLIAATGLSICAGLTGSVLLAQTTGGLCACLGAAMIVAFWHPRFRLEAADLSFVVLVLFALGLCARFFSELRGVDALLLCAAPLAAWMPELPGLRDRSPLQRGLLRCFAAAVPVGIAVTRAILGFEPDPYGDDYYDY